MNRRLVLTALVFFGGCGETFPDETGDGSSGASVDGMRAGETGEPGGVVGEAHSSSRLPGSGGRPSALGGMPAEPADDEMGSNGECSQDMPYASEIVSFEPGINSGYGQSKLPGVVLGPPDSGPPTRGSLDVLTLGTDGVIILGFGDYQIVNGPGPDFIVWENPFWLDGDSQRPFAELGEVAVSADGETWHAFPCNPSFQDGFDPGCAGWRPRLEFDPCMLLPIQPELSGGDPFDLAELGLESARFVRIRDLSDGGASPTAGFDLDAVGAIHFAE